MKFKHFLLIFILVHYYSMSVEKSYAQVINTGIILKIEYVDTPPIQSPFIFFWEKSLKIKVSLINTYSDTIYHESIFFSSTLDFTINDKTGNDVQEISGTLFEPAIYDGFYKKIAPEEINSIVIDLLKYNEYEFKDDEEYSIIAV